MIKFMVDSASDMSRTDPLCDIYVPISIRMDGKDYLSGLDIDNDTFYELLLKSKDFPVTAQPSPQVFMDIFEKCRQDGDEIIYFAISSALSGTFQGAELAKQMTGYDKIHIVDTRCATHMIGILVQYADSLRREGVNASSIVAACEELKKRIRVLAGVDTLEYLRRGGRLSNFAAVAGTFAHLKPVISVTPEGRVEAVGKALGKSRAMQMILEKFRSCELDAKFPAYTIYSCGGKNCTLLENKLTATGIEHFTRLQIGSAIGAHAGPEVYGVIFVAK